MKSILLKCFVVTENFIVSVNEEMQSKKLVIGITGHSGCGKSHVSKLMSQIFEKEFGLKCKILSADVMAFNLRNENENFKKKIIEILGPEVYDDNGVSLPPMINHIIFDPDNREKRWR